MLLNILCTKKLGNCMSFFRSMLLENNSKITVMEGAKHNLPDANAQRSAECIRELTSGLTEKDLLLVLISGNVTYPEIAGVSYFAK